VIPFKPAEDLWSTLVPMAATLLLLLAVAAAVLWYARRQGASFPIAGRERRLRVLERLALSRRAMLVVVEYEGRKYLIGQSGDQISLVAPADARPSAPSEHEPA